MALRWLEGFEAIATVVDAQRKYDTAQSGGLPQAIAARSGARGWGRNGGANGGQLLVKMLDAQATWIVGAAIFWRTASTTSQLGVRDSGTVQVEVGRNSTSGLLEIRRNGTVIATGTTPILLNQWYYVELKVTIANAGGSAVLHLNGVEEATFSGDTQATANATANEIFLNQAGNVSATWTDDWYACDGTGGSHDDFLGDSKVELLVPTAEGNSSDWTPSAGSDNALMVDETAPDDDATYVSSSTAGHKDTHALSNLSVASGTVHGIQQTLIHRKDDAGSRSIRTVLRAGGTDYTGATVSALDTYSSLSTVRGINPATASPFSIAEVNALEAGYELVT